VLLRRLPRPPRYRPVGGNVIDWLTLTDVHRVLDSAGIDLSDLTDAAAA
jgi:hypothetical protein